LTKIDEELDTEFWNLADEHTKITERSKEIADRMINIFEVRHPGIKQVDIGKEISKLDKILQIKNFKNSF